MQRDTATSVKEEKLLSKQSLDSTQEKLEVINKVYDQSFFASSQDGSDDFTQELLINWISKDSIDYKIIFSNQLCEGECVGLAINQNSKKETEINNYKGDVYPELSYTERKENILVMIKVDTNKNRATAAIYEGEYSSECSPYEHIMIERN